MRLSRTSLSLLRPDTAAAIVLTFLTFIAATVCLLGESPVSRFDGPAELPRRTVDISMPHQSGKTVTVGTSKDLQSALDRAACGDTIQLEAGASFAGRFTFPAKPCDDNHWIVIRTSAPDSDLPPPGTRLTPCYAGVASLPARPPLNCARTRAVTARIVATSPEGPIVFAAHANHYRFVGLELTRAPDTPPTVYQIAAPEEDAPADHVIFDRVWAHGTAQDEMAHGIRFNNVAYGAVIDSTFTDFHCIASVGACTDAQAVSGGNGTYPMGPFLIENNFLEASGENILFGGGPGTVSPEDITIRRNHLFKPPTWHASEPSFVGARDGHPFIVKNLFELKVGVRVLFEANVLDYTWGGFSQAGWAILLTPRNQALTPRTEVTDVTIRDCKVRHAGGGMQIADPDGEPVPSRAGERYSIHDVVFDDLDHVRFEGNGLLAQIAMGERRDAAALQHVKIDHVTAFPKRLLMSIGGPLPARMSDFTFTNNLVTAGMYALHSTGAPCSAVPGYLDPHGVLKQCFLTFVFSHNLIVDANDTDWGKDNLVERDAKGAGIANFNNGQGGDYHVLPKSRYRNKATDGKPLGADLDEIERATQGVE